MNGTKATAHAQLDKLRIERDEARNHAGKLAEALRELLKLVNHNEPAWNRAFDALGNWEGAK